MNGLSETSLLNGFAGALLEHEVMEIVTITAMMIFVNVFMILFGLIGLSYLYY